MTTEGIFLNRSPKFSGTLQTCINPKIASELCTSADSCDLSLLSRFVFTVSFQFHQPADGCQLLGCLSSWFSR